MTILFNFVVYARSLDWMNEKCCCYCRIGSVMCLKSTLQMRVWRQKEGRIENIKSENSRCHFFRQFSCYTNKNEIHVNNVIIQESKASRATNDECVRSVKEEDENWKNLKSFGTVFDSVFGKKREKKCFWIARQETIYAKWFFKIAFQ